MTAWSATFPDRSAVGASRIQTRGQQLLVVELELTGARGDVARSYESFLRLKPDVLRVCHDWQMRRLGSTEVPNDHGEVDYDAGVLGRLIKIDDAAQPVCADLVGRLKRFAAYGRRLSAALERALASDNAQVTDSVDSYHTVWFQLHEDLLVTLGISRDDESKGNSAAG